MLTYAANEPIVNASKTFRSFERRNASIAKVVVSGSTHQEVVVEVVDEKPTDEMMSARDRFWERVFVELLRPHEASFVSEQDGLRDQKNIIEFDRIRARTTNIESA